MKKGSITQLFTVLCYAVAIGSELAVSMIVSAMRTGGQLSDKGYVYVAYLLPQVCYLLVFALFALIQRVPAKSIFRLEKVRPLHYAYALMIAFGLFFVALLPNLYLQKAFQTSGSSSTVLIPPMETGSEIFLAILFICVLPALGEEMLFRKTFCEGMKGNGEWTIILLGGLFFSLTHFNLVQTVHQFVLGCVLCFLYIRTENVTLTMIVHFINNLLALFIERWTGEWLHWSELSTLIVSLAVGAACLAGGLFLVWKKTKKVVNNGGKVELCTIALIAVVGLIWVVSVAASYLR